MTSDKIGRYEIRGELGKGGMAVVYLAFDPTVQREVALKLISPEFLEDVSFAERFKREAHVIAGLEHSSIVPLYDFGEHEGQLYFVMRYMTGGSLSDIMKERTLSYQEIAAILKRIGSALDYAHQKGIIHRDLKPANIMFDQHGKAYLGDFGIARVTHDDATKTQTVAVGTPAYMSPEQALGQKNLDGRSDIYTLGVVLFELLTGKRPFESDSNVGVAVKHVIEPVPEIRKINPELPAEVDTLINRAMAKQPEARFNTAAELIADLVKAVGDKHEVLLRISPVTATAEGDKKREARLYLAVAAFVILCGVVFTIGWLAFGYAARGNSLPAMSLPTETPDPAPTIQATASVTPSATASPTPTFTPTPTASATATPTSLPSETATLQPTPTLAPTLTATSVASQTPTATATAAATATVQPPTTIPTQPPPPPPPPPTEPPPPPDPPTETPTPPPDPPTATPTPPLP